MFSMSWDTPSLEALIRLKGMSVLLDEELAGELVEIARMFADTAVENTWRVFSNPSGKLAGTIYPWQSSPREMEIRVDSPYGRRREYGFSGMTDSLGRFYANDPAKPYLGPALEEKTPEARVRLEAAIQRVLARVAGGQ